MKPLKKCASRGYVEPEPVRGIMTRREAAQYLRVDEKTFDAIVADKNVPRLKTARKVLFRLDDLNALFVASRSKK